MQISKGPGEARGVEISLPMTRRAESLSVLRDIVVRFWTRPVYGLSVDGSCFVQRCSMEVTSTFVVSCSSILRAVHEYILVADFVTRVFRC